MSDEEFLKRWSRRKQEAKAEAPAQPPIAPEANVAPSEPATVAEPEIDLSKLPPLDSITAATDITEFLRKGIPAELSHAALRRAWAADPAIRDFVGLAENAWDFTDPNAIPGFGALQGTPQQIAAMVERVMGTARETADKLTSELSERVLDQPKAGQESRISSTDDIAELPTDAAGSATPLVGPSAESVAAVQPPASSEHDGSVAVRRRTHGGALPS